MLDHVSITVTNIGTAEKFYDTIMSALSVPKVRKSELRLGYGERCDGDHPDRNYLSIKVGGEPDDAPARHWCFKAPNRAVNFGKQGWKMVGSIMSSGYSQYLSRDVLCRLSDRTERK